MDRNVKVSAIVEKMNLKNLTPEVDYSEKIVEVPDINRPALQLTGYFEHFDAERIQVIGFALRAAAFFETIYRIISSMI